MSRTAVSWGHPTHRQQAGEAVSCFTFSDSFRADKIADPEECYQDARAAHAWATRELEGATEPMRIYNLTQERKRLADIAWRLKR
jgi:hypothetical protein